MSLGRFVSGFMLVFCPGMPSNECLLAFEFVRLADVILQDQGLGVVSLM